MENWFYALIMSIIEGLTEFLPVSSSGHLILVGDLLNFTGEKASTFEVVIQLGAIMAVVVLYRERFKGLLKPNPEQSFSGMRGLWLLAVTSFPACLLGLLLHSIIKNYFFSTFSVLCALIAGSVCMLLTEKFHPKPRYNSLDQINTKLALGVGLAQCFALWAGFSRSASTIMGGILLGMNRSLAAEYSFIAAVPIMVAATGYDFLKNINLFTTSDIPFLLIGMLGAFFSALLAIKVFIKLLNRVTLAPFAIYRLFIAGLFYYCIYSR